MFNDSDWLLVIMRLNIDMSFKDKVQLAMSNLETNSPEAVPAVQDLLAQLAEVNTAIATEQSSVNNSLIRADVLEWEEGGRSTGMTNQESRLQQQLYNLLGLSAHGITLGTSTQVGPISIFNEVNYGWGH